MTRDDSKWSEKRRPRVWRRALLNPVFGLIVGVCVAGPFGVLLGDKALSHGNAQIGPYLPRAEVVLIDKNLVPIEPKCVIIVTAKGLEQLRVAELPTETIGEYATVTIEEHATVTPQDIAHLCPSAVAASSTPAATNTP
jgi:hypothetical protein